MHVVAGWWGRGTVEHFKDQRLSYRVCYGERQKDRGSRGEEAREEVGGRIGRR